MDRENTIDIAMAIDISVAPMTDAMLIDILTETKGIMDQYTDFKIHLFRFDTEVSHHKSLLNTTWMSLRVRTCWWRWY